MEELIVSKKGLAQMFDSKELIDSGKGWTLNDKEINIVALHHTSPENLKDMTNAKFYKLTLKGIK